MERIQRTMANFRMMRAIINRVVRRPSGPLEYMRLKGREGSSSVARQWWKEVDFNPQVLWTDSRKLSTLVWAKLRARAHQTKRTADARASTCAFAIVYKLQINNDNWESFKDHRRRYLQIYPFSTCALSVNAHILCSTIKRLILSLSLTLCSLLHILCNCTVSASTYYKFRVVWMCWFNAIPQFIYDE